MQIARNLLLKDTTKSYERKLKEIVLSLLIEREFSKPELLLKYVNMPYLGRGQYGIEAASRSYFGKQASDLSLEEVAVIVGLINRPNLIERAENAEGRLPAEVNRRARYVIERMREMDFIASDEESERAMAVIEGLRVTSAVSGCSIETISPYLVEEIRRKHKDDKPLNTGGMRIFVTVDPGLQAIAEEALAGALAVYRKRHTLDDVKLAELHAKRKEKIARELVRRREELSARDIAKMESELKWTFEEFKVWQAEDRENIRAMAFGVDLAGRVKFLIGGEDYKKSKFNIATQGFRQPGSTFKPFAYAARDEKVLEELISQGVPDDELLTELDAGCNVIDDRIFISRGKGRSPKEVFNFRSNNPNVKYYAGEISCKRALAESRNTAAVRVAQNAGVKRMIDLAKRLGVGRGTRAYQLQPYPTTAIGASDVIPIDMTAYLAFMNGGYRVPLVWEYDICKRDESGILNSILYTEEGDPLDPTVRVPRKCRPAGSLPTSYERVLHPVVAEHVRSLLMSVVDMPPDPSVGNAGGTAHGLRTGIVLGKDPYDVRPNDPRVKFPLEEAGEIAGKTGTATNGNGDTSDVWFIVIIPGPPGKPENGMLMAFWMGKTTKSSLGVKETGGRNLLPVAAKVLLYLKEKRGLLQSGHVFESIIPLEPESEKYFSPHVPPENDPTEGMVIDPSDPNTDPAEVPQEEPFVDPGSEDGDEKD
jgi:membrane carboxypeptidase/penicillin-binding protein